jgi:hypothetical protein
MPGTVQQSSFILGEVDPSLQTYTADSQQYLQAVSTCDNMYVDSQGIARRRQAFQYMDQPAYETPQESKHFSFQSKDGLWYQVSFVREGSSQQKTTIFLVKYSNDAVRKPIATQSLKVIDAMTPSDFDITATDNFVVVTNKKLHPMRVTIASTFTDSSIEDIKFSVVPSIDFADIDYSTFTFTPMCSNGAAPTGTPPACTATSVFGGIINVTHPSTAAGGKTFDADWIGGMIYGKTGASSEQPIGFGLITAIVQTSVTVTKLTITVLQAFGTEHYSQEGQTWSVRKPIWGDRLDGSKVYPSTTAFYQGRLWFANTPELPMIVAGSASNTPNSFNVGAGESPDAIVYILQNSEGGGIKHIFGGVNLHLFTATQQLSILSGYDVGITPGNFNPQLTSSYSSSDMKPIKYKDSIYFITSDGKAIVKIVEQDKQVSVGIISSTSQHLIKNPVAAAVYRVDNDQDQILVLLNSDASMCVFSSTAAYEIKAFSQFHINTMSNETLSDISVIDNRLYIYTNRNLMGAAVPNVMFDFHSFGTVDSHGDVVIVQKGVGGNEKFGVSYKEVTGGVTNWNYIGTRNSIYNMGQYVLNFLGTLAEGTEIIYGKEYTATLKTLPLYSGTQGSFKKRKVTEAWCQYYNSFNFTVNGKLAALLTSDQLTPLSPQITTGTKRFGVAQGAKKDFAIEMIQQTPYPMNIQKLAWVIQENIIV